MSARKSIGFTVIGFLLSTVFAVIALEIILRLVYPQESLYPRWAHSPQYCFIVYPNVRMVHECPGRWRFIYTTNQDRYRGRQVPVDDIDLRGQGVRLILLGVNGQLKDFPTIAAAVKRLQGGGVLRYVDAADWLENETNYASPEGHLWGKRAHRIIGERLAPLVQEGLLSDSSGPSP